MQHCNPLIHEQFTESKIQVVMAECYHLRTTRQIQQSYFKLLCNRTSENGRLLGEEPRNMVQQLFERPK